MGVLNTYVINIENEEFEFKYLPEFISVYHNNKYYNLIEVCKGDLFTLEEINQLHKYCKNMIN